MKQVMVAGGGISGLAAALSLLRGSSQLKVTLVEKSERVGGWLHTEVQDGCWSDTGPRSIRVQGGEQTLSILKEIGLTPLPANRSSKGRFVFYSGRKGVPPSIQALPSGATSLPSLFPSLPMWSEVIYTQVSVPVSFMTPLIGLTLLRSRGV